MVTPVVKQACRCGRYAPIGLIRNLPPRINIATNLIDKAVWRVGFEVERGLGGGARLARFRNRNDELGGSPSQNRGLLEGLAIVVERMMIDGFAVRRIQDRLFVESPRHTSSSIGPRANVNLLKENGPSRREWIASDWDCCENGPS